MRIKRFNLAALLNFLNVVKSNESNPDEVFRKKKISTELQTSLSPCKRGKSLFEPHNITNGHGNCHHVKLALMLYARPGGLVVTQCIH